MKPKKFYEVYLVVEGAGTFPIDMLRYDSAHPYTQEEARLIDREGYLRRIVLCRRGVNDRVMSEPRWRSFGWRLVLTTEEAGDAIELREQEIRTQHTPWGTTVLPPDAPTNPGKKPKEK